MEPGSTQALNVGISVQDVPIYDAAPLGLSESSEPEPERELELEAAGSAQPAAPPTHEAAATNREQDVQTTDLDFLNCKFSDFSENRGKFQAEISKWEDYYDQVHARLAAQGGSKNASDKTPSKSTSNFSMGQDGHMYYTKVTKGGEVLYLRVIRDYAERVRLCREIHLDTGDVTLHNRRDRMLELVGQMYFWKGQRRDVCQCIASCAVCSAGLGAKRKAKPPGQKRDIPRSENSSEDTTSTPSIPAKKKAKIGRPRKAVSTTSTPKNKGEGKSGSEAATPLLRSSLTSVDSILTDELAVSSAISKIVGRSKQDTSTFPGGRVSRAGLEAGAASNGGGGGGGGGLPNNTLDASEICFQQIFTTITDDPPPVEQVVSLTSSSSGQDTAEGPSIYELLFKLPSVPSNISPTVIEAVHMAMRHAPDVTPLSELAEASLRQVLSLGAEHNLLVCPTVASAYTVAVFASMLRMDPLSVSGQISSQVSSPLSVLHDSCCAMAANSDLGPVKSCTALTGAYNWNLGDMTYPMDRDMVKMAVQSNRVAAVFYQPYSYIEKSQHISLEVLSGVCHSRGCEVAVIVDASNMPFAQPQQQGGGAGAGLRRLVDEVKGFLGRGADMVLMPPVDRLCGHAHCCVLVGVAGLLGKVWRSIGLLQKQVCLPLLCLPHDVVGTVVAYKALQDV